MDIKDVISLFEKYGFASGVFTLFILLLIFAFKTTWVMTITSKISEKFVERFMKKKTKDISSTTNVKQITESDITNHDIFNYIDFWTYSKVPTFQFSTDYRTVTFKKKCVMFDTVQEALDAFKLGHPIILVDDEDRENEGDIVFAVVDNFAARKIIFDSASRLNNVDVFTGGNDDALFGSVYHYQKRDGKQITEHPVAFHPEYENPPDKNPGELSCQQRSEIEGGTQLLATNMAVAALILGRVQKTIVLDQSPEETEIYFDLGLGKSEPYNRLFTSIPVTV